MRDPQTRALCATNAYIERALSLCLAVYWRRDRGRNKEEGNSLSVFGAVGKYFLSKNCRSKLQNATLINPHFGEILSTNLNFEHA